MITRQTFEGAEAFAAMLHEVGGDVIQYRPPDSAPGERQWNEWSCTMAPLPSGAVLHFTSAGPIAGTGETDADKVVLLLPWKNKAPTFYRGVEMSANGAAIFGPSAEHVGKCDGDHAFTVFVLHAGRARDHVQHILQREAGPLAGSFWPIDLPAELRGELESIVTELTAMANDPGSSFLDENVRAGYEDRILNVLAEMISLKDERLLEEMPRHDQRSNIVKACWRLAGDQQERNLTIEDLCMESGVSVRSLRYAFDEITSNSPSLFLRNHRLHKAQRMLLGQASAVKEAAYSCGFTEMGRFSIYYRELFGESPSTTLETKKKTAGDRQ
jgi:AraC-like DNA-binding protein